MWDGRSSRRKRKKRKRRCQKYRKEEERRRERMCVYVYSGWNGWMDGWNGQAAKETKRASQSASVLLKPPTHPTSLAMSYFGILSSSCADCPSLSYV
jgi:hypothetical protein